MVDMLRVHLLGRLSVTAGDAVVDEAELPGRQGRLALVFLVCHRAQPVSRAELAEALWSRHPPRGWEPLLSTVVSRLRAVLPAEAVISSGPGYYQFTGQVWADVEQIDTELDAAQRALARGDSAGARDSAATAVELARQPLLPGYGGEWLDARREQLRGSLITGLEVLARAAEPAAAVRHAEEALALEPFRESVYQLLIDAHLAAGNRAEALRAYQRCRDVLAQELGVDPSPKTQQCYLRALRLGSTGRAGQPPLPAGLAGPERGRFVGRQVELDRLRVLVGSRTRLVLVTGEPGIGKTRLSARFGRGLHAEGSTVLFGRCGEEQVAPYQPFLEALRQLVIGSPPEQLRSMTGIWAPDLARILPELGDLPAPIAANPDTERFRLFEGVAAMLSATSAVVVVDDLQWADRPTLLLLRHIVRSAENVLVVATCRDGEIAAEHPVTALLADLHRDELVTRIPLRRLDLAEVAAMLEERDELAPAVHRLSAGNPFFVRQLIRHLEETGVDDVTAAGIPSGVTDVVRRRLSLLAGATQQCLIVGSVIGRRFDLAVVARATGLAEPEALVALEQATLARLVAEEPVGRFRFVHDVVRQAVYDQLGPSRRARLHRWVGEAIEAVMPDAVGELARHFCVAHDPAVANKAVDYALRAAAAATAQLGFEEAARHCEAALELADDRRGELALALGEARAKGGDPCAQQAFLAATDAARASGDTDLLARAVLGLTFTWGWTGVVDKDRIALLERALAAIGAGDDALRAQLLARLAGELYFGPELARRDALSAEAVAVARRLGDPGTIGRCLDARTYAIWGPGGAEERLGAAREIVGLAEQAGDPELAVAGHAWGITAATALGDIAALDAEIAAYAGLADQLRQPRYQWYIRTRRSMRAALAGDFDAAMRWADEGWRIATRAGEPDADNVRNQRFVVWMERLEPDAVPELDAQLAAVAAGLPPDADVVAGLQAYVALMHLLAGDESTARSLLDQLTPERLRRKHRDFEWTNTMISMAWVSVRLGEVDRIETLAELLAPYARYGATDAGAVMFLGSTAYTLGMLATSLGCFDEAERYLGDALAFHQRMGATPWVARTRFEQARLAIRRGRSADADGPLADATSVAQRLGMRALRQDLAALTDGVSTGGR
ncbi:MAG TPA: AAA family ATPase [Pseudonocardiaceae bacterium]|nr:AAA family ATPase [Pseudonocardiaceae bacterium]